MISYTLGFILDLIIGEPHNPYHPVRGIGAFAKGLEKRFREIFSRNLYLAGGITWFLTIIATYFITSFLLGQVYRLGFLVGAIVEGGVIYFCISSRGLAVEGMKVIKILRSGDIEGARHKLSYIVGRDTSSLDEKGIVRAVVETVSENMSDGIIAPMMFAALGGAPLAMAYKAVNTCDSMFGYKNDKYREFGYVSAKMDDIANFIPARVTAYFIVAAAYILKYDYKGSLRIYKRDRYNHLSPNSAHPEAAVAGALGIRLGGVNYYFGKPVEKPTIGDDLRPISVEDVDKTNRILMVVSLLGYFVGVIFIKIGG
ncbi:MAG: adenosylcobinamide-phosphate synthase CbiB [Clostridium sp.]